jgi:hypothetical protein
MLLLRYARLAQELGIEMLCIGTELVTATQPQYTTFWERLIDTVRRVYGGWLLYAANWEGTPELPGPEFVRIRFWHRLDFVGVNFYPPLTSAPEEPPPPMEQALGRWQRLVEAIAELARAVGRPVILAEVGCPSVEGALAAPWDWRRTREPNARADLHAQEFYYEAVRSAFQGRPWLAGIFWWEWGEHPLPHRAHRVYASGEASRACGSGVVPFAAQRAASAGAGRCCGDTSRGDGHPAGKEPELLQLPEAGRRCGLMQHGMEFRTPALQLCAAAVNASMEPCPMDAVQLV